MSAAPGRGAPRRTPTAAVRAAAAGAVAVAVLAGCARTPTLDRAGTERAIEKVIGGRITQPIEAVTCPAHLRKGEGEVATCRAVLADGAGTVRLRVRQTDGDAHLDVDLLDAVVDRTAAATALHRELVAAYERTFTVDCGDGGPIVVAPGKGFTCSASDGTSTRTVRATVTDAAGTVTFDIGDEPTTTTTTTAPSTTTPGFTPSTTASTTAPA